MRTKTTLLCLLGTLLIVTGCQKEYGEASPHALARLMIKENLFDPPTATRIEVLNDNVRATHKLSEADADWLLTLLDAAPVNSDFTEKSVLIISVLDPVPAYQFNPDQKRQMFALGSRILAASPTKDFMRLTGGLKLLEKSGDKRGVAIAQRFRNNPHWTIRNVSKTTVLALNGKG